MASNAEILAKLQADLAKYEAARDKILNGGQDIGIGPDRVRYPDLETIEARIKEIRFEIQRLQDGVTHSLPLFSHRA